jgi:hypothetical protein
VRDLQKNSTEFSTYMHLTVTVWLRYKQTQQNYNSSTRQQKITKYIRNKLQGDARQLTDLAPSGRRVCRSVNQTESFQNTNAKPTFNLPTCSDAHLVFRRRIPCRSFTPTSGWPSRPKIKMPGGNPKDGCIRSPDRLARISVVIPTELPGPPVSTLTLWTPN